ncbi:hypothetical protein H072_3141 [Dactylellina haptotyla CBS 200.50]|uniref:Uncharacterized protein n=1 Tax=Dactylellina haptotyla (strain CBS 200.50) TaxID=1284197 RepID=S8C4Y4_DACHA|nr:hypothetical protein H072_3141 [Dactylellina haptotyla CBS 200.50]
MFSPALCFFFILFGLFGLPALAKPIQNLDAIVPATPIWDGELQAAITKRVSITSDLEDITAAIPITESDCGSALTKTQKRAIGDAMSNAVEMVPVLEDDLIPIHLQKRETSLRRLELKNKVTLLYGGAAVEDQKYLANMTLQAPDPEHPLIMMENFKGLTTYIRCAIPQKRIQIRFRSNQAMSHATEAWKWVNSADADYFYLIANDVSCCPTSQRKPFKVVGVKMDTSALAAELTIETTSWNQVARNFELNLGKYDTLRQAKRNIEPPALSKRFFGLNFLALKLLNFLGILSSSLKDIDAIFLDLSMGSKGRVRLFADPFHEDKYFEVNCVGCYTTGGIELGVHVKTEGGNVKNLGVYAQPKGLGAKVEVEFQAKHALKNPISFTKSLTPDISLPGFSIPSIFTLGPSAQFNAGFDLNFDGVVNFTTGVEVKLPDSAMIVLDLVGGNSGASGFEKPTVKPILRINELNAKGQASSFVGPVVAFGAKVLDAWRYEGAVQIRMPNLAANLHAGWNAQGFCPNSRLNKKAQHGINGELSADFQVWFKLGHPTGPLPIPDWLPHVDRKLWGQKHAFLPFCLPIPVPGLEPGAKPPPPVPTKAF